LPAAKAFPSSGPDQVNYLLAGLRDDLAISRGVGKNSEIARRLDLILKVGAGLLVATDKALAPHDKIGTDAVSGKAIYAAPAGTKVVGHNPDGTPIYSGNDPRLPLGRNADGTPIYFADDAIFPPNVPFVPAPAHFPSEITGYDPVTGNPIYKTLG
jgi:hypothetical protein